MLAAEPALRRMRWGSLKSRSYDHAGDRRREQGEQRPGAMYSSLDRRDERREPPPRERYRRANGRDYEYRRDYDDRYRDSSKDRRDDYYEDDYRDKAYRYERREERRDERRDDRREYDDRRRREDDRYRRDRREEPYREERSFDYADKRQGGYDQGPGRPPSQLGHIPGPSGYTQPPMASQMSMGQLTQQMSQMHLQQGMPPDVRWVKRRGEEDNERCSG